jgi:hypothetical protein
MKHAILALALTACGAQSGDLFPEADAGDQLGVVEQALQPHVECPESRDVTTVAYLYNSTADPAGSHIGTDVAATRTQFQTTAWNAAAMLCEYRESAAYAYAVAPKVNGSCPTRYSRYQAQPTNPADFYKWQPTARSSAQVATVATSNASFCYYQRYGTPTVKLFANPRTHNCRENKWVWTSSGYEWIGDFRDEVGNPSWCSLYPN